MEVIRKEGQRVPVLLWSHCPPPAAVKQLQRLAAQPWVVDQMAGMPDLPPPGCSRGERPAAWRAGPPGSRPFPVSLRNEGTGETSEEDEMPSQPQQRLDAYLEELTKGNPDVSALLVIDGAGRVQASRSASSDLTRVAVAMAVPLRELLDRTSAELGCGELRTTLVEGTSASFAIADVDGDRSVVVVGASKAIPGALRADSLWLADQLRVLGGETWT